MSSIPQTIARLAALRTGYEAQVGTSGEDRLSDLTGFGANPGALRARSFVPEGLGRGAALVVVLHGCTQTAAGYDHGSGWSRVAEEHGFALLLPEQQRANNPNLCFNWFSRSDAGREQGEALSIRQMIAAMVDRYDLDPARVFVTGLSAGGAMAAVMLATYPELFAGGAVIAGLPYGTAWSVQDALARMRGEGLPTDTALAALVTGASQHGGPWPTLSVWHGDADTTVRPANAEALLGQWRMLHAVDDAPEVETVGGHRRQAWRNAAGRIVIEDHRIAGMGHGTPLAARGPDACGVSGPHMLDVGVSSTRRIAAAWGLVPTDRLDAEKQPAPEVPADAERLPFVVPVPLPAGVEQTIRDALRTAGLMR